MIRTSFWPAVWIVLASFALAGCAHRAEPPDLPVDVPLAFSSSGAAAWSDRWWTEFDDPELSRLIEAALTGNFDLQTAWHRLQAARAIAKREAALLYPTLDGEGQAEYLRRRGDEEQRYRLGLAAAYEVDLWGRLQASADADYFQARASLHDYRAAALSLAAEVARTWYRLGAARQQVALLEAQVTTNAQILDLIETRFHNGLVRSVDLLRQQQLVEATREQLFAAEGRARTLDHLLAVLLGRAPQNPIMMRPGPLPDLPPLPETGLPVELVRRRPDVRAAFERLRAADRDLAAAISNQYPRFTLSASLATEDDRPERLFDAWLASLAGNLLAPIYDAGRRQAEVERTAAVRDQRLASYAQVSLTAFREVEDALIGERQQAAQLASLAAQVELAARSSERLRSEYLHGIGEYLDALVALTSEQQLRRDLIAARADLLGFRIGLYRALAGDFGAAAPGEMRSPDMLSSRGESEP